MHAFKKCYFASHLSKHSTVTNIPTFYKITSRLPYGSDVDKAAHVPPASVFAQQKRQPLCNPLHRKGRYDGRQNCRLKRLFLLALHKMGRNDYGWQQSFFLKTHKVNRLASILLLTSKSNATKLKLHIAGDSHHAHTITPPW